MLAVVVLGVVGVALYSQANPTQLGANDLGTIQGALKSIPAGDVPGKDIAGVPRPSGSTRSYFLENSAVTTVIYNESTALPAVQAEILQRLLVSGWKPFDPTSPAPGSAPTRLWQDTYYRDNEVLQINMVRTGAVTSTTFVRQAQPQ